jgi:steroid 5-alpha reductase family enzyme
MTPFQLLLVDWTVMAVVMFGLWSWQLRTQRADVVDLGWTVGVGAAAVLYALALDRGLPARRALVAVLAVAWSARLALHLFVRLRASGEDGRYTAMRAEWGEDAPRRFLRFFQGQAVSVPLISGQFMLAMLHPARVLTGWDALGSIVVLGSIAGEAIADRQLAAWKRDPANAGRTCRRGLWRYSRHPNYFFEWLHWLGYSAIAVGSPLWPATLLVPAIMYILVVYVTGIPPSEAQSLRSRGEDYRLYQQRTNAFFPGPPRQAAERAL